jgi:hypothetical protein
MRLAIQRIVEMRFLAHTVELSTYLANPSLSIPAILLYNETIAPLMKHF